MYVTGVQMHERHIGRAMLSTGGLTMLHAQRVSQSGVANKLSATYNTLEIWRVGDGGRRPEAYPMSEDGKAK